MTIFEYNFYSQISKQLFDYMNGKINKMNNQCILYIDMYDNIRNTYATIRYPNHIFLHIGNVIDSWHDEWNGIIKKEEYVCTVLSWAIAHELFHADQAIQMVMYLSNSAYKEDKENDVQRASYDWVCSNQYTLSRLIGIQIDMEAITSDSLPDEGHYRKASAAEFYKQTIANTILKDLQLFNKMTIFTNDLEVEDIVISFSFTPKNQSVQRIPIVIKSCGKYLEENVSEFSNLVYNFVAYYDVYSVNVDIETVQNQNGRSMAIVDFQIENPLFYPMMFKK